MCYAKGLIKRHLRRASIARVQEIVRWVESTGILKRKWKNIQQKNT